MKRKIIWEGAIIEYEWSRKRIKNLNLRIRSDGTVAASSPMFVSGDEMDRFVEQHGHNILCAKERCEAAKRLREEQANTVWVLGERLDLNGEISTAGGGHGERCIAELLLRQTENGDLRRRIIEQYLFDRCREQVEYFFEKLFPLFKDFCPVSPTISYRKMKARWGSCQPRTGKLLFNKKLAHVPPICIEYVVCHELTHFLHPNHSHAFYEALSARMPDWKERKQLLTTFEERLL